MVTFISFAQNGINYKAIVKDNSGNVVANQTIDVQFTILEDATNVYQETHTPTTDANGLIIVNIGEGTTSDVFADIDWAADDHFLNVQIDTGSGLTDMGTTQFMAVPYALQAQKAANVTGLEAIDEGNGIGWRLKGRNPINYDNIGDNAIDLSDGNSASEIRGASGDDSFATGVATIASGDISVAMGFFTEASGNSSTAIGSQTSASGISSTAIGNGSSASGNYSTALGFNAQATETSSISMGSNTTASGSYATALGNHTTAESHVSTTIGRYNNGGGNPTSWVAIDPLFEIGNGTNSISKSNALTVLKNGTITAPSFDLAEITDDKALITKEYADSNLIASGLEALDEGNGSGWRLIGVDPADYNNLGNGAIDLSRVNLVSTGPAGASGNYSVTLGLNSEASGYASFSAGQASIASGGNSSAFNGAEATGSYSFASGGLASGNNSTAMGISTIASGFFSTALGLGTLSEALVSTAIGRYNVGGGSTANWVATDPLFEIGNGTSDVNRANALTILKNGTITAPSFDLAEITDDKALITKEYADTNLTSSGLEALFEGNGIGWRLKGSNPANYGDIGVDAIDLSFSYFSSTENGATGEFSTAMGFETVASGYASFAMGYNTDALGSYSTAMSRNTEASGNYAIAMGYYTKAEAYSSTAMGRYNIGGGSTNSWISTDPLFEIGNGTSNANRDNALTILKNGKIGIDKYTGINAKLDIDHASSQTSPQINIKETSGTYARLNISNAASSDYWAIAGSLDGTTSTDRINFYHSNVGDIMSILGNGNVLVNGSVVHSSDLRLKENIETIPYGLDQVLQLQPKAYNWKAKPNQDNKSLGLIAQEVQTVIQEIVHEADDEDKTLSVSYTELIPVLIKAIQEQQEIINNQDSKFEDQENKINGLTAELEQKEETQKVFNQRLEKMEALIMLNNQ
jgi:hypothetical protein